VVQGITITVTIKITIKITIILGLVEEDPEALAAVGVEVFGIGDGVEVACEVADKDAAEGEALGPFVEFGLENSGTLGGVDPPAAKFDLFAAFVDAGDFEGVGAVAEFLLEDFAGGGFEGFGQMNEGLFVAVVVAQGDPFAGAGPGKTAAGADGDGAGFAAEQEAAVGRAFEADRFTHTANL